MNFFEHQDAARKKTRRLVVLYLTAVVLIITTISLVVMAVIAATFYVDDSQSQTNSQSLPSMEGLWMPDVLLPTAAFVLLLIVIGSVWKLLVLRAGGRKVAESLGGVQVHPSTNDPLERRLLNVVEEMALASGISMPAVYLLKKENSINAFAAGFSPSDAVIGVTKGCMTVLSRDELQGVIAHEFSHVLNGDMRLNLRLIGILNGILVVALTGFWMIRIASGTRGRLYSKKGGDPRAFLLLVGSVLCGLGYIGVLFGRLIKSAVSRQREYLADASAVQFTRNPLGLSGALQKIGGLVLGSKLETAKAEEASHLFFSNGMSQAFFNLLATHPPLAERITRVDRSFKGSFPKVDRNFVADLSQESAISQFSQASVDITQGPQAGVEAVKLSIGNPSIDHLRYVQNLLVDLPVQLRQASYEPFAASALVFALLLDSDKNVRERQLSELGKCAQSTIIDEMLRLEMLVGSLPENYKLPLVDMCVGALRQLSAAQFEDFEKCLQLLIAADEQVTLFEYALAHSVKSNLQWAFGKGRKPRTGSDLQSSITEITQLLSALAWLDAENEQTARKAFRAGLATLGRELELRPRGEGKLETIDHALQCLASAAPRAREKIIEACIAVIMADGHLSIAEGELLRAVSSSLDCPMPPLLPGQVI